MNTGNMKMLLDTHILIWVIENSSSLSGKHAAAIGDRANEKFVSEISFLELAIKINIGKLPDFKTPLSEFITHVHLDGFNILPIKNRHLEEYKKLPLLKEHHDPFDRVIISTAISENMGIITADGKFNLYNQLVEII
jgi:PIN domain nuclease of toxin-antitoxin system